jgi:hypothetical protein
MVTKPAPPGRMLAWLVTGLLVGGISGPVDGILLGVIFGNPGPDGAGLLPWIGYVTAGSALFGVIVAGIARAVMPRMILKPPSEEADTRSPSGRG